MDIVKLISLTVVLGLVVCCVAKKSDSKDWLDRAALSAKRNKRTDENTDTSSIVHVNKKSKGSCCKNGGICIMGSFCHCPDGFYGRRCQHVVNHRNCGTLKHGTWVSAVCNLCHCFDGQIICKAHDFPNCGSAAFTNGVEENPDYQSDMEFIDPISKTPFDYEKFYESYEDVDSGSSNVVSVFNMHCLPLLVVIVQSVMGLFS